VYIDKPKVSMESATYMFTQIRSQNFKRCGQSGFSLVELIIVLLIVAILAVIALPQINQARRLMRFAGLQRQVVGVLRDARQEAMTQRKPITIRYVDSTKQIFVYDGKFGAFGDSKNLLTDLSGSGIQQDEIIYGKPATASLSALGDGSNVEPIVGGIVEFSFQADGTVVNAGNSPVNKALFFFDLRNADTAAFAVSVLGAGGRVKVWRYVGGIGTYVE
jgi:prepilin-type N-terminal cleavage/methylation domain-containing protein